MSPSNGPANTPAEKTRLIEQAIEGLSLEERQLLDAYANNPNDEAAACQFNERMSAHVTGWTPVSVREYKFRRNVVIRKLQEATLQNRTTGVE